MGQNLKIIDEKHKLFYTLSTSYSQDADCTKKEYNEDNYLEIETNDGGGGKFFILKTDRWAFTSLEDLMLTIKDFIDKNKLIENNQLNIIDENVSLKKETLAIDFDGVIHSYNKRWTGDIPEDLPMEGVKEALKELKENGWRLVILSTRKIRFIKDWLIKYKLDQYIDDITNEKIPAKVYIDDRGYRFKGWKETLDFMKNINKGEGVS